MNLSLYRKAITAILVGLIGWAGVVITSPQAQISASEWLGLATALATALGVYSVPNDINVTQQAEAVKKFIHK